MVKKSGVHFSSRQERFLARLSPAGSQVEVLHLAELSVTRPIEFFLDEVLRLAIAQERLVDL